MEYDQIIAEIMVGVLRRMREKRREDREFEREAKEAKLAETEKGERGDKGEKRRPTKPIEARGQAAGNGNDNGSTSRLGRRSLISRCGEEACSGAPPSHRTRRASRSTSTAVG
jgi:hypothetical protein